MVTNKKILLVDEMTLKIHFNSNKWKLQCSYHYVVIVRLQIGIINRRLNDTNRTLNNAYRTFNDTIRTLNDINIKWNITNRTWNE